MTASEDGRLPVTRRSALAGAAASGVAAALSLPRPAIATERGNDDALLAALEQRITEGMARYAIPGVAVGLIYRGRTYMRGYGVTDIGDPKPIDVDTLFRVASNSKPFTGTTAMRLVDQGRLVLDRRVDSYLDGFVAPPGAQSVTVRQLLNHSAGWLGYDYHDTGADDGALARYVHDIRNLPQLTPVGEVFSYSNAALSCAGRVIETVTGLPYETAVEQLVMQPLGMSRSRFSMSDRTPPAIDNLAMPHAVGDDGKTVAVPELFFLPRAGNPFGGVLSSVRDMLAFAAFHLGNGRAADGSRVMSKAALRGMWSTPGPGGTLMVELIGMGVSWIIRPTAEGVVVVQHGGDLPGYHSGFMLVPAKRFGMVLLTNSESGPSLIAELFVKDWALRRFAGVSNLPAPHRSLSPSELAPYEGTYTADQIGLGTDQTLVPTSVQLKGQDGALAMTGENGADPTTLTFYRDDYVIIETSGLRANFLRDEAGAIAWLRLGGRLWRRTG